MVPLAQFDIDPGTLNTARTVLIVFLVVFWLALVYYTFADARRRLADLVLVGTATATALIFPFIGTIVYMIVRPPEFLDDVRERELETRAAEARLAASNVLLCPHCETLVEKDFLRCPACLRKLKDPCGTCGKPLDPEWRICPFCEAEIPGRTPRRRRRRRPEGEAEAHPRAAEPG